jgi:hypothetical protein
MIVYCNGDSHIDSRYPTNKDWRDKIYCNYVGQELNAFVINQALSGSCTRRIIRTSVHDLILHRRLNPHAKIVALISLSFDLRSEIWWPPGSNGAPEESDFITHTFSDQIDWRERLFKKNVVNPKKIDSIVNDDVAAKYYEQFSKGRAFFFSTEAERINFLCDLIMFRSLLESLKIDFLIFQGPPVDKLSECYLKDFFQKELSSDQRFFDFENFSFTRWCHEQEFIPYDFKERPLIGHYEPNAHEKFAQDVILPALRNTAKWMNQT